MVSGCISITVITVLSMFSLVVSKPFLGELLTRVIASSSTPDDPQSHVSDFRMMMKMDHKADKLQLIDSKENKSMSNFPDSSETSEDDQPVMFNSDRTTVATPTIATLWQRWNRTDLLARIIDDVLKPAQERITLVFQTLVPKNGDKTGPATEQRLNSTNDDDSDESDLELPQPNNELTDQATNATTLLGQFQARRKILRRRVAKALSSITGLLILAANTRKEGNSRSTRSVKVAPDDDGLLGSGPRALVELPAHNLVDPYKDYSEALLEEDSADTEPRRNMETLGIFLLEVLGSMAGFSWGIFKQVQSFFWYAIS